jgi:hypothetical protein
MSLSREGALDPARQPDLLQSSFAGIHDDGVFPWGIPIWWEFLVVGINADMVDATAIGDVLSLAREQPGMVYTDPVLNEDPIPFPADVTGNAPPSEAGVFFTVPSQVPVLREQVSQLRRRFLRIQSIAHLSW